MMAPKVLAAKAPSLLLIGGLMMASLRCGNGGGVTPPDGPAVGLSETA